MSEISNQLESRRAERVGAAGWGWLFLTVVTTAAATGPAAITGTTDAIVDTVDTAPTWPPLLWSCSSPGNSVPCPQPGAQRHHRQARPLLQVSRSPGPAPPTEGPIAAISVMA